MAKKKKDVGPEEKKANKEMADFVKWFFEDVLHSKADHIQYIRAHKTIKPLLWDDGEYDSFVYPVEVLYTTIRKLVESGVGLYDYSILLWPNLVRSVYEEDNLAFDYTVDKILQSQKKRPQSDRWVQPEKMPDGWQ